MRALLLPALAAAALLPGCGGGEHEPPNTPEGAVRGFVDGVSRGDWGAACERIGTVGTGQLTRLLPLDADELDYAGELRDCERTLDRHAADVRRLVEGAKPGAVTAQQGDHASVASPKGEWTVLDEVVDGGTKRWVVADFPGDR